MDAYEVVGNSECDFISRGVETVPRMRIALRNLGHGEPRESKPLFDVTDYLHKQMSFSRIRDRRFESYPAIKPSAPPQKNSKWPQQKKSVPRKRTRSHPRSPQTQVQDQATLLPRSQMMVLKNLRSLQRVSARVSNFQRFLHGYPPS